MSNYRFTYVQRAALLHAYGMRCFYCKEPLKLTELTIDHVLPERLLYNQQELRRIRVEYELDSNFPGFSINDYCNWVPTHSDCNSRKRASIYPKRMALFYLQQVQEKLPKVEEEIRRLTRDQRKDRVLGNLAAALEKGVVSRQELARLLDEVDRKRILDQPIVVAFGLVIKEVLQSGRLSEDVPKDPPYLYDWLENDLVNQLRSLLSCSFHYTEPSLRDGECLSARLVFLGLDPNEFQRFYSPWWQVLEVMSFYEIYGTTYEEAYPPSQA